MISALGSKLNVVFPLQYRHSTLSVEESFCDGFLDISVFKLCVFTVKDLVESSVADTLEWPHRMVVPVGNTPADVLRWFFL